MKGSNRCEKRIFIGLLLACFLVMCAAVLYLIHMEMRNYEDKMRIINTMLESGDDLKTASGLLKGTGGMEGSKRLEQYGFDSSFPDVYAKESGIHRIQIAVTAFVIFLIFTGTLFFMRAAVRGSYTNSLKELEMLLEQFRGGIYKIPGGCGADFAGYH